MNVSDFWIDNHDVVKILPPSAVYAVAAPRLSNAVREKVLSAVRAGDCRTLEDVKVRIRQERGVERALDCLHDQAWSQAHDAMHEVITILIEHLPPEQMDRFNEFLDMIDDVHFRWLPDELRKRRNGD
jgi:hypothetical protein